MEPQPGVETPTDELNLAGRRPRLALPRSWATILVLFTGVWVFAVSAVGTWSAYWADNRLDQYALIYLGQCVHDGGTLYVDCWENKPPGIAWISALGIALSKGRCTGAWIAPGVTLLLCLALAGVAIKHALSLTASCVTVLLASVVATLRLYDNPSVNPDSYSSMFDLAALSLWVLSVSAESRGRRLSTGLAAGLLWAASATVKQTGVVSLLAVSAVTVLVNLLKGRDRRRWITVCALSWMGFALGTGMVAAVLARDGSLGAAWHAVFLFNRGLLNLKDLAGALTAWSRLWAALEPVQLPLWLGLVGVIAVFRSGSAKCLSRSVVSVMVLCWIAQAVLAMLGPSRAMRYWQATWPAMFWLAGAGIYYLESTLQRLTLGQRSAVGVACATIVLLLGRPLADQYGYGLAASYTTYQERDDYSAPRNRLQRIATEIRNLVPQGQSIYVWAYDAGVYLYASRLAASRFIYPQSEAQMHEILADLDAGKPYAVFVPERDAPEFNRWCDQTCHDRLAEILSRFQPRPSVDRYSVWVRLSTPVPE